MAKVEARQHVLRLRQQGKSYNQIREQVKVSKSTLSRWLHDYPLSSARVRELRDVSESRIEKFRKTMQKKRATRLNLYYIEEKARLLPLSEKELLLAGLFLYWGEGNKASRQTVAIYNTDPALMKFALHWLKGSLKVPQNKIRIRLHLYSDMNIEQEIFFWHRTLSMPKSAFTRPYVKTNKLAKLDRKGFGHGTCGLVVHNTFLKEHIMMALKAVTIHQTGKMPQEVVGLTHAGQ